MVHSSSFLPSTSLSMSRTIGPVFAGSPQNLQEAADFWFTFRLFKSCGRVWTKESNIIAVIAGQTWSNWLGRLGSMLVKRGMWTHWVFLLLLVSRFLATKTAILAAER